MSKEKVFLSASRIKVVDQCGWVYWCKYKLKLPDRSNDGASRGTICHAIFECLGNPRHKKHYDLIVNSKSSFASPSVARMISIYAKKLSVNDPENLDLIDEMTVNGLLYDFFGRTEDDELEEYSEKSFSISVDEGDRKYNIRGFIDKLFLYKNKSSALIRDFKSSKAVFKGKEITDNLQDLMYCLAVKHLYPDFLKRTSEFVFLRFDLSNDLLGKLGKGIVRMEDISDEELLGFEYQLTEIQAFLEDFDESNAMSNFAAEKSFPSDGTFGGPLMCGKDGFKKSRGEYVLDKNGDKIKSYICQYRKPFEYYALLNKSGKVVKTCFEDEVQDLDYEESEGFKLELRSYGGCAYWNAKKNLADDFL
jgi:hypothetical protein